MILDWTGNQCNSDRRAVVDWCGWSLNTTLAAEFCTHCNLLMLMDPWMRELCLFMPIHHVTTAKICYSCLLSRLAVHELPSDLWWCWTHLTCCNLDKGHPIHEGHPQNYNNNQPLPPPSAFVCIGPDRLPSCRRLQTWLNTQWTVNHGHPVITRCLRVTVVGTGRTHCWLQGCQWVLSIYCL